METTASAEYVLRPLQRHAQMENRGKLKINGRPTHGLQILTAMALRNVPWLVSSETKAAQYTPQHIYNKAMRWKWKEMKGNEKQKGKDMNKRKWDENEKTQEVRWKWKDIKGSEMKMQGKWKDVCFQHMDCRFQLHCKMVNEVI